MLPRKRAKTEDEKEQRRVERVLRNRRAAQSSRERKRLEVEALEQRNKELETLLLNAQKENLMLYQRLTQAEGKSAVLTNTARNTPVTLSQELFSSQDGHTLFSEVSRPQPWVVLWLPLRTWLPLTQSPFHHLSTLFPMPLAR